jgi:hypothetical protein
MHKILPAIRPMLIGLGLIVASASAEAKVYRCVVDGNTTYADRPCAGADSEAVNMIAPRSNPGPAAAVPKVASVANTAPAKAPAPAAANAADSRPERAVAKSAVAGWRIAGGYRDRIPEQDTKPGAVQKSVRRASYGIECEGSGLRPSVYAINDRYSLTAPDHGKADALRGPFYDSLDAAAAAACAAK